MPDPRDISINDFTYDLPQEKIATHPLGQRDESKLLIYRNREIREDKFKNIGKFLEEKTLLVFNNTKVIRARLNFLNEKGQAIEIFCLEPNSQQLELTQAMAVERTIRWNCLVGNLKRWKKEELRLEKNNTKLSAGIFEKNELYVVVEFSWEPSTLSFLEVLEIMGNTPIPPYLKRESEATDLDRYQTVYAKQEGSVAAPTAGLHFTKQVFEDLRERSIRSLSLTLHVGAGTFKPVKAQTMQGHDMHAEWLDVRMETLEELLKNEGDMVIAVGTTSLRTLESLYWMGVKADADANASLEDLEMKQWEVYSLPDKHLSVKQSMTALVDWMIKRKSERLICHTQILIAPPYELKMAQGIITNFHQPQSTLLLLISAVVGSKWKEIYEYALHNNFRFLSYGDSSLLLK